MKTPILNIDDLVFEAHTHGASFAARIAPIANRLGARLLGARVVVLPPGGSRQARRFNAMVKDAARTDYWEDET